MRRLLASVALLATLTACGGDDKPEVLGADGLPLPTCQELDGQHVWGPTWRRGCMIGDELMKPVTRWGAVCRKNGIRMYWSRYTWGYEGDIFHFDPEGPGPPLEDECLVDTTTS